MLKFDSLPQLAVGSHDEGSGRACIMNALSYLTGQTRITDTPTCVWQPLAYLAQAINDSICDLVHPGAQKTVAHECSPGACQAYDEATVPNVCKTRSVLLLCPACTHKMWLVGARMIGTAEHAPTTDEAKVAVAKAMLRVALDELLDRGGCSMIITALKDMLDGKATPDDVKALFARCDSEHDCSDYAVYELVLSLGRDIPAVIDTTSFLFRSDDVRDWEGEFVHVLRNVLVDSIDRAALLNRYIDAFEKATGFRALAPLPSEIEASAQRAGLALV